MIPAAAGVAALLAWPAARLRDRWRLPEPDWRDAPMLLLALLLVPLFVARPFSLVGVEIPEGHVYRAYFTADYVWRRAVVAELAKGDFLPANPFYVGDVLHYYWLPHLISAIEYRAWGSTVSLDTLLLTRSILVDAAFVASPYGIARLVVPGVGGAGRPAVDVPGHQLRGHRGSLGPLGISAPFDLVRLLNIDAITRWLFGGMPIDGLHRVLLYQPQHAPATAVAARGDGRGPPHTRARPCGLRRGRRTARGDVHPDQLVRRGHVHRRRGRVRAGPHHAAPGMDGGGLQRRRTRRCRWRWPWPSSPRCSMSTIRTTPT